MSAGHTHLELAGSELTAGILTGLAMCAVLQSVVLYQNFKPWFKKPHLTQAKQQPYLTQAKIQYVTQVKKNCT